MFCPVSALIGLDFDEPSRFCLGDEKAVIEIGMEQAPLDRAPSFDRDRGRCVLGAGRKLES
jgi:hypothetical protein